MKKTIVFLGMVCMATSALAFGGGGSGHDSTKYNRHNPGVDNFGVHIHPDNPPLDIRFYDIKNDANAQPCQEGANVYCCKEGYVVDVATSKCVPCPSGSVATLEENFKCTVCEGEMIPNQDNTACVLPPEKINEENQCKEWGYKWCLGNETCVEKETPCPCPCELSPNGCRNLDMNFNSCCQVCDTETGLWTPAENGLMRCNLNTSTTDKNTGKRAREYGIVACYNGEIKDSINYHGNQQECEKYGFYYFPAPMLENMYGVTGLCLSSQLEADSVYLSSVDENGVANFDYCYTEKLVIFHEDDQSIHYYTEWQPRPHTGKKIAGIPDAQGACAGENEELYCARTNRNKQCQKWYSCAGQSTGEEIFGLSSASGACATAGKELYCISTDEDGKCIHWSTCDEGQSTKDLIVRISEAQGVCSTSADYKPYCGATNDKGDCIYWTLCNGQSSGKEIINQPNAYGQCNDNEVYCTWRSDNGRCYSWDVCPIGKAIEATISQEGSCPQD